MIRKSISPQKVRLFETTILQMDNNVHGMHLEWHVQSPLGSNDKHCDAKSSEKKREGEREIEESFLFNLFIWGLGEGGLRLKFLIMTCKASLIVYWGPADRVALPQYGTDLSAGGSLSLGCGAGGWLTYRPTTNEATLPTIIWCKIL